MPAPTHSPAHTRAQHRKTRRNVCVWPRIFSSAALIKSSAVLFGGGSAHFRMCVLPKDTARHSVCCRRRRAAPLPHIKIIMKSSLREAKEHTHILNRHHWRRHRHCSHERRAVSGTDLARPAGWILLCMSLGTTISDLDRVSERRPHLAPRGVGLAALYRSSRRLPGRGDAMRLLGAQTRAVDIRRHYRRGRDLYGSRAGLFVATGG